MGGRIAIGGIASTAAALIAASAAAAPLGAVTAFCGALVFGAASLLDRTAFAPVIRSVSWPVLGLVAGLFVLVAGLERTGLLRLSRDALEAMAGWPPVLAVLGAALTAALGANVMNNLPAALIAGSGLAAVHGHEALRAAVAIGIDLGPNLSVTGSLATVLWLIALRRENITIDAWTFLRAGAIVMPPALVLAVLSVLLTTR
jgi:arsenical pump membrane protein